MKKFLKVLFREPILAVVYFIILLVVFFDFSHSVHDHAMNNNMGYAQGISSVHAISAVIDSVVIVVLSTAVSFVAKSWLGSAVGAAASAYVLWETFFYASGFSARLERYSVTRLYLVLDVVTVALLLISVGGIVFNIRRAVSRRKQAKRDNPSPEEDSPLPPEDASGVSPRYQNLKKAARIVFSEPVLAVVYLYLLEYGFTIYMLLNSMAKHYDDNVAKSEIIATIVFAVAALMVASLVSITARSWCGSAAGAYFALSMLIRFPGAQSSALSAVKGELGGLSFGLLAAVFVLILAISVAGIVRNIQRVRSKAKQE